MHCPGSGPLTGSTGEQIRLPFVLMRGGTSKAVFLTGSVLPEDHGGRDAAILSLFGSPDPRQVDGLGGADLLTSKLAIIDPPTRSDADLDYTFAQVSVAQPVVDFDINCGNISAAVGAYAVDEGLVTPVGPVTSVRIHNTNTGRVLVAEVPVIDGVAAVEGNHVVHGVPGTGAPIALDFGQTAGGITGSLLPTGRVADVLDTAIGPIRATIMDLANLTVFFSAAEVGMAGTEGPEEFIAEQMAAIEAVKEAAAELLGIATDGLTPVPAVVSPSADYTNYTTGGPVGSDQVDLIARVVGGRPAVPHKAYPGTLAACTGVAACMPGTTVHGVAGQQRDGEIRIGHPCGVMPVQVDVMPDGSDWTVDRAVFHRTARRLAEGTAFIRRSSVSGVSGS
ncbi:MAG: PrpF domain-containing protein [Acidimicrobiales bacterium]|nr:PrpF domain-containing protein [Acidimicrobiales bacterium]MDP7208466.1 PrpF domain-containing protein [Acidimicrobiales bacterium]